jgi:tetratricopeptide (TPR) repeat protein
MGRARTAERSNDLVSEVHRAAEDQRTQLVRRGRRRKLRRIFLMVLALVLLTGCALVGVIVWEERRLDKHIAAARAGLEVGTPTELSEARALLEKNLVRDPEHAGTLAMLALVQAHQAVEGSASLDELEAAVSRSEDAEALPAYRRILFDVLRGTQPGADAWNLLAREILAVLEGSPPSGDLAESDVPQADAAWLGGLHALASVDDFSLLEPARAEVTRAIEDHAAFMPLRRLEVALDVRAGLVQEALEKVEQLRAEIPEHLGLAVDQALYHAVVHRELGGVVTVATALRAREDDLSPRERARATLALGIAALHEGEIEEGTAHLESACAQLPAWDRDARDLAIEAALRARRSGSIEGCIEGVETSSSLLEAWIALSKGDVVRSLTASASVSQQHPRVAYIQALGLVEQGRFEEAQPWIDRALRAFAGRPELEVASARIRVHTGDRSDGLERLQELSATAPHAPRVWTGLAQALAAEDDDADEDDAAKSERLEARTQALKRALEREHRPADAAFMLGQIAMAEARGDLDAAASKPKKALEAAKLHAEAIEHADGEFIRAVAALGLAQAWLGDTHEAEATLRSVAASPGVPPEALLGLVELVVERSIESDASVPAEVEGWLQAAASWNAEPRALAIERARLDLGRATPTSLEKATTALDALLREHPDDVAVRVLHIRTLHRNSEFSEARISARAGLRKVPQARQGPLHLQLARLELDAGDRRLAATMVSKGWPLALAEPRPPVELLAAARFATGPALAIDKAKRAISASLIAAQLTKHLPFSVPAWLMRSRLELADAPSASCTSAAKAVELAPELAEAHFARGACLARLRDLDGARTAYRRASELASDPQDKRTYERALARLR